MKRRRDQFLNFLLLLFLTRAIKMEIRHGVVIPFDLWTRPLCQPLASGHCSRLGSSTASSGCVHYSLICTSASSCQQTDWQCSCNQDWSIRSSSTRGRKPHAGKVASMIAIGIDIGKGKHAAGFAIITDTINNGSRFLFAPRLPNTGHCR